MIYIAGVGRSGTSLIARMYKEAGYSLGHRVTDLYEDARVQTLNDRLIKHLGGDGFHNPPPAHGSGQKTIPFELYERAYQLVSDGRQVIKDPRLSILMPFWRQIAEPKFCVLALRQPDAVAESFRVRDSITLAQGYRLYIHYTQAAWQQMRPRVVDYYDWYASSGMVRNLANLELPATVMVFDPKLDHYQIPEGAEGLGVREHAWEVYTEIKQKAVQ